MARRRRATTRRRVAPREDGCQGSLSRQGSFSNEWIPDSVGRRELWVARRLRSSCARCGSRASCTVGRMGGDEQAAVGFSRRGCQGEVWGVTARYLSGVGQLNFRSVTTRLNPCECRSLRGSCCMRSCRRSPGHTHPPRARRGVSTRVLYSMATSSRSAELALERSTYVGEECRASRGVTAAR